MNLEEFLKLEKPEDFDLKNEGGYQGNSSLELALEYKFAKDRFDCDGTGNDYWDIKMELQYLQNSRLSDYDKKA